MRHTHNPFPYDWRVWAVALVVGSTLIYAATTRSPAQPNPVSPTAQTETGQFTATTGEVTDIDRAAALALSATDWPNDMRIVNAVREGVQEIHRVCPKFGVETIGQGLALKYDTKWDQFVQKASQLSEPPEAVAVTALHFVHASMILDLQEGVCGPQDAAPSQEVVSKKEPAKISQAELDGPLLYTKTLDDWAYAPAETRLAAAERMASTHINYPIKRYPESAVNEYGRAIAACIDGVANEGVAYTSRLRDGEITVYEVGHRCHMSLSKKWDFGPPVGPGSAIADAKQ